MISPLPSLRDTTFLAARGGEKPGTRCHAPSSLQHPASPDVLRGLRICFLAGTLGQGGAERQLFYNLKCLSECGAKVDLLCLTKDEYWEKPISNLGVAIHYVGGPRSRFGRLLQVFRLVRQLRPQVMQSQHFYTNSYLALAARMTRSRDVGAIRNDGFSEVSSNGPLFGRLNLKLPRLLAVNSLAAMRNLKQIGVQETKIFHLPNIIDTVHFAPCTPLGKGAFTILGVGRLAAQKRFDRFLQVLAGLQSDPGLKINGLIYGSGPLQAELENTAHLLTLLPDRVSFMGSVPDVRHCFAKADVLLLASDHEGTPNVVMEAMACGVPVVATKVGGVTDLIKNGETGFLFEPDDLTCAQNVMKRLANDPQLGLSVAKRARSFIQEHHSLGRLPQLLAGLYAKVLGSSSPANRKEGLC